MRVGRQTRSSGKQGVAAKVAATRRGGKQGVVVNKEWRQKWRQTRSSGKQGVVAKVAANKE